MDSISVSAQSSASVARNTARSPPTRSRYASSARVASASRSERDSVSSTSAGVGGCHACAPCHELRSLRAEVEEALLELRSPPESLPFESKRLGRRGAPSAASSSQQVHHSIFARHLRQRLPSGGVASRANSALMATSAWITTSRCCRSIRSPSAPECSTKRPAILSTSKATASTAVTRCSAVTKSTFTPVSLVSRACTRSTGNAVASSFRFGRLDHCATARAASSLHHEASASGNRDAMACRPAWARRAPERGAGRGVHPLAVRRSHDRLSGATPQVGDLR